MSRLADDEIIDDRDIAKRLQAYLESEPLPNGQYRHTVDMRKLLVDVVGVTLMSGEDLEGIFEEMRRIWHTTTASRPQ